LNPEESSRRRFDAIFARIAASETLSVIWRDVYGDDDPAALRAELGAEVAAMLVAEAEKLPEAYALIRHVNIKTSRLRRPQVNGMASGGMDA
jgi:hypothetical protein